MGRRVNFGMNRVVCGERCPVSRKEAVEGLRRLNTMNHDQITPWHIQAAVEPAIVHLTFKREKKRIIHKNAYVYIPDEWDWETHHELIRNKVTEAVEPGWSLTGYCFAET